MDFAERTWQKPSLSIRYIDLGQQSSRAGINRFRRARDFRCKLLSRKLLQGDDRLRANLDEWRVGLRHAGVNTQWIDAGDVEQFPSRDSGSGINQSSRVDVALREHARKGSINFLKAFQLLQAPYVRIGRSQVGLRLLIPARLRIRFLRRDGIALA